MSFMSGIFSLFSFLVKLPGTEIGFDDPFVEGQASEYVKYNIIYR